MITLLHHIPREHDTEAGHHARRRADRCTLEHPFPWPQELQIRVEGGVSEAGGVGCGWVLWGSAGDLQLGIWRLLATGSWPLPGHLTPGGDIISGARQCVALPNHCHAGRGFRGTTTARRDRHRLHQGEGKTTVMGCGEPVPVYPRAPPRGPNVPPWQPTSLN